ncbi:MAG TPA: hypothetical protein VJO53_08910 [Candidatus Acidoferrales bacterium]|nr:hypothetical protein [Candidatus Acidoferrales bacterium]
MFVPWWAIAIALVAIAAAARGYSLRRAARLEKEIARLRAQLTHEQEFSAQLISLMPEDTEEEPN